eukprot:768460-Hanusia_phi.AAC.2
MVSELKVDNNICEKALNIKIKKSRQEPEEGGSDHVGRKARAAGEGGRERSGGEDNRARNLKRTMFINLKARTFV